MDNITNQECIDILYEIVPKALNIYYEHLTTHDSAKVLEVFDEALEHVEV